MDHIHPTTYAKETLKATLNCYQIASVDSLSGPGGLPALVARMWYKQNKELPPIQPQPLVQIPYLIPNDKAATRSETLLAGENIACFIVGGEKRLCLPQILTSVLREYSIAEINQACAELHIYCSRCLPEQLQVLKALSILPINTAQCGLITKTDAERLVALLTDRHDPYRMERLSKDVDPDSGIPVYHECFGRGYGIFYPKVYATPNSACISCKDCGYMYSPQRFITHSDRSFEKRTCHWGFDPDNWRSYLLLPKDLEGPKREEYQKALDHAKARFGRDDGLSQQQSRGNGSPPAASKRRIDSAPESPTQKKKIKEEDSKAYEQAFLPNPYASMPYGVPMMRHSAFRPWSPRSGPEMPVAQEMAHLKGLVPFALDRHGLPQYLQTAASSGLPTRESEFALPKPATEPRHIDRKRSQDQDSQPIPISPRTAPDRNAIRHGHQHELVKTPSKTDQEMRRSRSFEHSQLDHQSSLSRSSSRISVASDSSVKASQLSPVRYVSATEPHRPHKTNGAAKESVHEISRPASRSREAAASAMLELKAAGQFRARSPTLSGRPVDRSRVAAPGKFAGTVVPLDSSRQHYKWTVEGQSYIVSAAGVQALESIRAILEGECSLESARGRLMHEFVKSKSLFEEKIDIEMRVRRDLETELDHLKTSSSNKLQTADQSKRLLKQEMENMKEEHSRRLEELQRRQSNFPGAGESRGATESNELRLRIKELELKNDDLRSCLREERERRERAESKLCESDSPRGRIPFFMDSPLSRMVRDVTRKSNEDEKVAASSPSSRKTSPSQDHSVSHTPRGLRKAPPLVRPGPRDATIPADLDSQKIVVVT